MMMNFQKFRAESPWITGLLWLTSLVSYYALSNLEMGLQLFALLFLVCVVVTLAAIAATPFAVITLWRQRDRATRYVRVPDTVANADWKGMAKTGQAGSAKVGAAAASGLGRLSTRVGTRMGITLRWVREWPWTEIRRKTLWVMANVIVTFLPLVVFGVGLLAFILFDALRDLPKNYLLVPFWVSMPLSIIAGIALKTRFGMPRLFTFSPELLTRIAKVIMYSGPVIAVLTLIGFWFTVSPSDRGWIVVMTPFVIVCTVGFNMTLGGIILLIAALVRRSHGKKPPTPPMRKAPQGLNDTT